jgi:hypothetical protein
MKKTRSKKSRDTVPLSRHLAPLPYLEIIQVHSLIKKKIKVSSYIRKFRIVQLQSHIGRTASSYTGKYLRISSYIRKPFLIYDFATAPL